MTQPAHELVLGDEWIGRIREVNERINKFPPNDDLAQFGRVEWWEDIRKSGAGDCDDYMIAKFDELREIGVPDCCLCPATCLVPGRGAHGVLLFQCDNGAYVLDNLTDVVWGWQEVNYIWVERYDPYTKLWVTM